ncbi:hypothetical protein BH23ACT10_BH23ACT10_00100 [soil metagenome]
MTVVTVRSGVAALLVAAALMVPVGVRATTTAGATGTSRSQTRAPTAAASTPTPRRAVAPVGGRVLRRFERPATPYGPGHRGVDLDADPGEPVRAALAGTVAFAGPVGGVPWVTVAHGDGLDTTYGGLEPAVRVGDRVSVGDVLGHATRAGHVDWGARHRRRYVDPLGLLGGWMVRLVPVDGRG